VKVANQVAKAANFLRQNCQKQFFEEPMSIISVPKLIKSTTLIEKLLFISKSTHEHYVLAEGPDA